MVNLDHQDSLAQLDQMGPQTHQDPVGTLALSEPQGTKVRSLSLIKKRNWLKKLFHMSLALPYSGTLFIMWISISPLFRHYYLHSGL